MDAGRWQEVRELFLSVCEVSPSERGSLLAEACGDDTQLRAEVDALLVSSEQASAFFVSPRGALFPAAPETRKDDPLVNRRIGAYRLVRTIASGGMGTVYLAERADEQYHKTVAIKLMRRGMPDADSLRRFRNERQALALLDHPNIGRLLDGGVAEDGTPYLVMEYVEGQPIGAYCDAHRLSTIERLRLFRVVCSAVHYAHQNLVVHRDLKPSNILVTPEGLPKLLDFGIAKMLETRPAVAEHLETVTGNRPMTPEYASPEQVRGEPVTTASDIYSLGVVLYELLTGHRPYRFAGHGVSEIERTILETDPLAPSSVIWRVEELPADAGRTTRTISPESVSELRDGTPQRLSRRLRGDLDNIVLMPLRKEPQRRYASAARIAEDIDNYLAHRPVTARKDTVLYRAAKLTRRHTVGVVATLLVILSLAAGAVGIASQARVAARERDEAMTAKAEAEAIVRFLEEMLTSVHPDVEGRDASVREVLDKAAARIEDSLEVDPKVKASLHRTIGLAYGSLGLYDDAEPQLRRALEVRRADVGDRHPQVTESLNDLGDLLFAKGALDEAEQLLRQALDVSTNVPGHDHATTIDIKTNLAEVLGEHRDTDEAHRLLREVLAARREQLSPADFGVAEALDRLADIAADRGNWDEAADLLEEALRIHQQLLNPGHPLVIESLTGLAGVRQAQGEHEEASRLYAEAVAPMRRALAMHRSALGDDHMMTIVLINDLAQLLHAKGDLEEATRLFRDALDRLERLADDEEGTTRVRNNLATVQYNLAIVLHDRGKLDEAEQLLRGALAARRELLGPAHLDVADTLSALGQVVQEQGDSAAATHLFEETLRIRRQLLAEEHPLVAETRRALAALREAAPPAK